MHDSIETNDLIYPSGRRVSLAFVISILLHAVLLWILGRYLFNNMSQPNLSTSRKIQLQLSPAKTPQKKPAALSSSATSRGFDGKKSIHKEDRKRREPTETRKQSRSVQPQVSSHQILTTAIETARQFASIEGHNKGVKTTKPIESTLAEALNPKREPAGVSTLSDGRIRVVTEWGLVYCIRPQDEARIEGPEDNLPVSMICH